MAENNNTSKNNANQNNLKNDNKSQDTSEIRQDKYDTNQFSPENYKYGTVIRFSALRYYGLFVSNENNFKSGDLAVVQSHRGIEMGLVRKNSALVNSFTIVDSEQEADNKNKFKIEGSILRKATINDLMRWRNMVREDLSRHFEFCYSRIQSRNLPMKLIAVEIIFSADKIIFYFSAAGRVDFRELVKDLAREFKVRIELRQIGARDESKLLGDLGMCGRQLCCRQHLWFFDPITMKMAKNQQTTLDPTKISGICSRLKCCMNYEDNFYSALKKELPRIGLECKLIEDTKSLKANSKVKVLNHRVLVNLVLVEFIDKDTRIIEWVDSKALKWDIKEALYNFDENVGKIPD